MAGLGALTFPAFMVMVDAAESVVPLSLPLGILRHIKQFQVIFQQTEAGSPYRKELPGLILFHLGGGGGAEYALMRSFLKFLLNDLRYLNEILQVCSDMYEAYFRH